MEMVEKYLTKMYRTDADFVFTVSRDFVRNCQTPVLLVGALDPISISSSPASAEASRRGGKPASTILR
jgi:hypothetical protein